jgi:hypothetical protein
MPAASGAPDATIEARALPVIGDAQGTLDVGPPMVPTAVASMLTATQMLAAEPEQPVRSPNTRAFQPATRRPVRAPAAQEDQLLPVTSDKPSITPAQNDMISEICRSITHAKGRLYRLYRGYMLPDWKILPPHEREAIV